MRDFDDFIAECQERNEQTDRETGIMANTARRLIVRNIYADIASKALARAREMDEETRRQWEAPRLGNVITDRIGKVA